jgi:hypothetical protein
MEYMAGVQTGVYHPNDAIYRKKDRGIFQDSLERPTNANTFTDKIFDKIEE